MPVSEDKAVREPALTKIRDVVFDNGIQDYLAKGWDIEVVCLDAFLKGSYWSGQWVILMRSPDEQDEVPLVSVRSSRQSDMRLFKSANAVLSFLYQYGVGAPHVPLRPSERRRQVVDGDPSTLPLEPRAEPSGEE